MSAFLEIDLELRDLWNHMREGSRPGDEEDEFGDPESLWAVIVQHGLEEKIGAYLRWAFAVGYFTRRNEERSRQTPRFR
jgi:hypothetical protein